MECVCECVCTALHVTRECFHEQMWNVACFAFPNWADASPMIQDATPQWQTKVVFKSDKVPRCSALAAVPGAGAGTQQPRVRASFVHHSSGCYCNIASRPNDPVGRFAARARTGIKQQGFSDGNAVARNCREVEVVPVAGGRWLMDCDNSAACSWQWTPLVPVVRGGGKPRRDAVKRGGADVQGDRRVNETTCPNRGLMVERSVRIHPPSRNCEGKRRVTVATSHGAGVACVTDCLFPSRVFQRALRSISWDPTVVVVQGSLPLYHEEECDRAGVAWDF